MITTFKDDVGALPDGMEHWHSIDWKQCYKTVQRLQARIVKATQAGRWNKVKALQRLLTHSFSGKALAVRRVTENRGQRTSGVDRELWSTSQQKFAAIGKLKQRGYKALPLRRVMIPKSNGNKRPLGIPTMTDRAMQALYALALEPIAETRGDKHSYGFRAKRSTADAMEQCYTVLARNCGAPWILEADIDGCFDNISHAWLLDNIPMDKPILKCWLKAGYMTQDVVHATYKGTPQGGVISPLLANMALDGLGKLLRERYPMKISSRKPAHKVNFIRYADDFIITGSSKEQLEEEVLPLIQGFLKERGLVLSQSKTRITHIDKGFDFLGYTVRKYDGKLLIKPSKTSVKKFLRSMRYLIKRNKMMTQHVLTESLNPRIRGWCQYYRHMSSARTFSTLRHELWKALWNWAKQRHPNKGRQWIKDRYFFHNGRQDWCFGCEIKDTRKEGTRMVTLYDPSRVPIIRHVKIRADCNPYDPSWNAYLENRNKIRMKRNLKRKKQDHIWRQQKGLCPVCHQPISEGDVWEVYSAECKSEGKENKGSRLHLLHLTCNQQVISRKGGTL